MPDDDTTVMCRFVEDLIVPEAHWSIEQLSGCDDECRIPQEVVQAWGYAPCAECVEEDLIGIGGFVCVEFVEEMMTGVCGVYELCEFATQRVELRLVEHLDSREVAVLAVQIYLFIGETILLPTSSGKEVGQPPMITRQIFFFHTVFNHRLHGLDLCNLWLSLITTYWREW